MGSHDPVRKERRKDGSVHLVIDFFFRDPLGQKRRFRRDARATTLDAARAEARRLIDLAARTGSPHERPAAISFREFVDGAFERDWMPRYKPSTAGRYRDLLKQRLLATFGSTPIDRIGKPELQAFAGTLARDGVQARGPMNLVRSILRAAVDAGILTTLPEFPPVKGGRQLVHAPAEDDVQALLNAAQGWLHTAIALAAYAGLRNGEVRALEAQDVDLQAGVLRIRRAFSADEVRTPKSGCERVVPIAAPLRPVLEELVRLKLPRARLVVARTGETPSRQAVLTRLKGLEARLGMRTWSFHQLRHAFVSELVRRGASLEAVRLLAGHSDLATTQRYVHAQRGDLAEAIDLLSRSPRQ